MSWFKAYSVAMVSLLAGAAVVHNLYKPDLRIFQGSMAEEKPAAPFKPSTD
jgi:hypothetical protein